jgi:hypothetical protein
VPKVSDAVIADAAAKAGFRDEHLTTAVAVALAESGGNTTVINAREPDGSKSFGLWQINNVHGTLLTSGDWREPRSNAGMAFIVWQRAGRKWTPWGAYNNQSYRLYLVRAESAVRGLGTLPDPGFGLDDLPNPVDGVTDALSTIGKAFTFVTDPHNWIRVITILTGLVMLGIVFGQLVASTGVFKQAKGIAGLVATKGASAIPKGGNAT